MYSNRPRRLSILSKISAPVSAEELEDQTPMQEDQDNYEEPPRTSGPETVVNESPMMPNDIRELFVNMPFFKGAIDSEAFVTELAKATNLRNFYPGDIIIRQGETAKAMFFIAKGSLEVISDDGEIVFGELTRGSYVGEIGIMFDVKRTATVVAKTKCTLLALTAEKMIKVLNLFPNIKQIFENAAKERIVSLTKEYEKQGKKMESMLNKEITNLELIFHSMDAGETEESDMDEDEEDYDDETEFKRTSQTVAPVSMASALARKIAEKRRASVAVWSDDKLMKFAQNVSQKTAERESRVFRAYAASHASLLSSMDMLSPHKEITEQEQKVLLQLDVDILKRIIQLLPLAEAYRLCSVDRNSRAKIKEAGLIKTVDLTSYNKKINNDSLTKMISYCGVSVQYLVLKNCWAVTDIGLSNVIKACPRITVLSLASVWDITDSSLHLIGATCPLLISLDLSNCRKITDTGVTGLFNQLQFLQYINFSYCKNLTQQALSSPKVSDLKDLHLQRCTGIPDMGFLQWNTISTATFDMVELDLSDCSFLTDAAIEVISKKCSSLKILLLPFCCSLTENCFQYLIQSCPFIEILDVSFCGGAMTDAAALAIANGLPKLRKLGLRGCAQLTDIGVEHLALFSHTLAEINISQCRNVSSNSAQKYGQKWNFTEGPVYTNDPKEKLRQIQHMNMAQLKY